MHRERIEEPNPSKLLVCDQRVKHRVECRDGRPVRLPNPASEFTSWNFSTYDVIEPAPRSVNSADFL